MVKLILLLLFVCSFHGSEVRGKNSVLNIKPAWLTNELRDIQSTIESTGVPVMWTANDGLCQKGVLGAYIPHFRVIRMCVENHQNDYDELVGTLKHEGWHAVQVLCNGNRAAFSDEVIRRALKPTDSEIIHEYHPSNRRLEAEARLVEQIPTDAYTRGVLHYCFGTNENGERPIDANM